MRTPPYTWKRIHKVHWLFGYAGEVTRWQPWPHCGFKSTPPGAKGRQMAVLDYREAEKQRKPELIEFVPGPEAAIAVAVAAAMPKRRGRPRKSPPLCLNCGEPLPAKSTRRRLYCDANCRNLHWQSKNGTA